VSGPSALGFLRRWWLLLVLGPIVAGVAGFAVVSRMAPIYEANTTLLVTRGSASGGPVDDPTAAESLGRTYVEALKTRPVLEEAERRTGQSTPMKELLQAVNVRPVTGTQLLHLTVDDHDPQAAADMANAIVAVFSEQNTQMQAGRYDSSRQNLEQLVSSLRSEIDSRTAELDQLRTTTPAGDPQLARLESDLAQLQATYSDSVRTYENLRVAEAQGLNGLTVVEPAIAPAEPIRPNKIQAIAIALVAGLLIALATGVVIEYLDDGLRTRERLAAVTDVRALASIPRWAGASLSQLATQLTDAANDRDARRAAESYRVLFGTLSMTASDEGAQIRSVMITSAAMDEGKSVTAANLAAVFAEAGKRVILVDADVHRPSQMKRFELNNRAGLSTLLLNPNIAVDSVLRYTSVHGLRILTSGPSTASSSAVFTSPRFAARLAELRDKCDVLVIDTAPVLAQSDAVLIGQHVDGTLFIVDSAKSRGRQVHRALEMLSEAGVQVLGAVFNGVPPQSEDYVAYNYASDAPAEASVKASPATVTRPARGGGAA